MAVNSLEIKGNSDKHPSRKYSRHPSRRPSIEDASGVRLIHLPGLVIPVFSGEAFLRNWYYLDEKGSEFVQRDLGRSEKGARALMEESMRLDNLLRGMSTVEILRDPRAIDLLSKRPEKSIRIPSVILVRHEDTAPGDYFAITVQRMFLPKINYPDPENPTIVPTMYHGLRAVDEEERRYRTPEEEKEKKRLRIGRLLTDLALLTHRGAERYIHRTFYAIPVWANMNAENLVQKGRFPYDQPYDKSTMWYMHVKEIARLLGAQGSEIEPTGVSRGVTEPNKRVKIENHPQVIRLDRLINDPQPEGFGVDPSNGDLIYGSWKVA